MRLVKVERCGETKMIQCFERACMSLVKVEERKEIKMLMP